MNKQLLLIMLLFTTPAMGQSAATGSYINTDKAVSVSEEGRITGDAARAIGDAFADCVVRRHYRPALNALNMARDSAEQYNALHRILDQECWAGSGSVRRAEGVEIHMTTNPISFRNGLYKALVRRDYAKIVLAKSEDAILGSAGQSPILRFSTCLTKRNPASSLRLALSLAGSKAERAAFDQLQPQFGLCLYQGESLALTVRGLATALPEAYYRTAEAAQTVGVK